MASELRRLFWATYIDDPKAYARMATAGGSALARAAWRATFPLAAAVMTAILRPPQFPYPLPEPWPAALVELRDGVSERPGCGWVLDVYARHRAPSAEVARGRRRPGLP